MMAARYWRRRDVLPGINLDIRRNEFTKDWLIMSLIWLSISLYLLLFAFDTRFDTC